MSNTSKMNHFIQFENRTLGQELIDMALAYKANPWLDK
jgi:N-succinyl-L-ornithine transcarbamylase